MPPGRPLHEFPTVAERQYWAYADLAKAHAAVTAGATSYSRVHFMIREAVQGAMHGHDVDRQPAR